LVLVDIFLKKFGILLNKNFLLGLLLDSGLRNNLVVRLTDIDLNNGIIDQ